MLMFYVSDTADGGFLHIVTLMMGIERSSSNSNLTIWIGGRYMRAFTSEISHGKLFVVVCLGMLMELINNT